MRALAASTVLLALIACASPVTPLVPMPSSGGDTEAAFATLTILVPLHRERARFVSPATHSIAITIAGAGQKRHVYANLTPSTNPHCKGSPIRCTLTLALAPGRDRLTFATYDGFLKGGLPTGNELSANRSVPVRVKPGKKNSLHVTLYGIPGSAAFVPGAGSELTVSYPGYSISKCFTAPQHVDVIGVDADGNDIVGPGAPSATLTSDGPAHLAVKSNGNGAFTLTRPHLPAPGTLVHLSARVSPPASIAGGPPAKVIPVSFNDDICGVFAEYSIPTSGSGPENIAAGPDGELWFTECLAARIARITTAGTVVEETPKPASGTEPVGIATGADGNVWFTEYAANHIGQQFVSGGLNEVGVPTSGSHPYMIASGPDGALWFTEFSGNNIGRVTTLFGYSEYPVTTGSSLPSGITAGPDGHLWFTENLAHQIGRIDTAGTQIDEYATPTTSARPFGIAAGPDVALWFTETNVNKIGRITTTGSVTEFSIANRPWMIANGPDGALWFTEHDDNKIGRITTTGTVTEFTVPTSSSFPWGIVTGPDHAIWFTEYGGNKIGRLL